MRPRNPKSIKEMFNIVAGNYDFLNDLFSFGIHRIWKRELLKSSRALPGERWLDMCCGTGDLSFLLVNCVKEEGEVVGLDFAAKPLLIAKKRARRSKRNNIIKWLSEDALDTKLPSHSFDGALMAYGLRNLADPQSGIDELFRLVKPGGKVAILDFNKPPQRSFAAFFQKIYLRLFVVPIAFCFGMRGQYAYLEKSLELFPSPMSLKKMALNAGFNYVSYRILAGGLMGILSMKS